MAILGVDVGGTFTDAVLLADGRLRTAKVPTRRRQEESVLDAARAVLDAAGGPALARFAHGTTVATNALLERKGARTAFVTTEGFEHLLHLRRQNRAHLYRLDVDHPEPLVPLEPLRVERYALRLGSCGAGEHRGGDGVIREIRALEPCRLSVLGDRRRHPPSSVHGGEVGALGRTLVNGEEIPGKEHPQARGRQCRPRRDARWRRI